MGSIPLPALGVNPPQQQDPLGQYARLAQLRGLQQGQQLQQQQIVAAQQENQLRAQGMKDMQIFMKSLQTNKGDFDAALDHAAQNGMSGQGYLQFGQQLLARKMQMASLSKEQLENQGTLFNNLDGQLQGYRALGPEDRAAKWPALRQQVAQSAPQLAQLLPQEPPTEQQLDSFDASLLGGKTITENALKARTTAAAEKTAAARQTQAETSAKEFAARMPGGQLADVNKAEAAAWLARNPGKDMADFLKYKATLVPQFNFNLQTQGVNEVPLNLKQQATAQAIIEGRMSPPGSFALKTPYWQNVMGEVFKQDPQWSEQRAQMRKAFTVGKQSNEINAINTAMGHVGVLSDSIDALKNGDIRVLNAVANRLGVEVGRTPVTTFSTIIHRLGPELTKAYIQAGGTQGERGTNEEDFSPNLGPDQLKANVAITAKLLRSKIASLENQWNQNKSDSMPDFQSRFIMPQAKAALDRLSPQGGTQTGKIFARDPNGRLHQADAGTPLPAGWKLENK